MQLIRALGFDSRDAIDDDTGMVDNGPAGNDRGIPAIGSGTGYGGGDSLRMFWESGGASVDSGGSCVRLDLGADYAHVILFCRIKVQDVSTKTFDLSVNHVEGDFNFAFADNSVPSGTNGRQCFFGIQTERFSHCDGTGGAVTVGTGADTLTDDTWYDLEIEVKTGAGGFVKLRRTATTYSNGDDMQEILNINDATMNAVRYLYIAAGKGGGSTQYTDIDDLVVYVPDGDSIFEGAFNVEEGFPDTDGGSEEWSTSSGTDSFALVDEVVEDGDTSYIKSSATGQKSLFEIDLPVFTGNVVGLEVMTRSRNVDANANISTVLQNGATENVIATHALTGQAYTFQRDVYDTNLTAGEANAMEIGVKS